MAASPTCYRHPNRLAVEHCEECQKPVCGACLWYAESGERLCPDHATELRQAGQTVHPPERYAEAIAHSQASAAQAPRENIPYKGNSVDVMALAATITGLTALLACGGLSWAIPLIALILGFIGWLQSKDALDPKRARWMSLVGLTGGGVFLVVVAGFFVVLMACFVLQFALLASSGGGGPRIFPTPTP